MIGRFLCWIGAHKIDQVTIEYKSGGPLQRWNGCVRCRRLEHPDIIGRRGITEIVWPESRKEPTWGYVDIER